MQGAVDFVNSWVDAVALMSELNTQASQDHSMRTVDES